MRKIVTEYRVPYADTDQMGVVYYGNYMALFERARNDVGLCAAPRFQVAREMQDSRHVKDAIRQWLREIDLLVAVAVERADTASKERVQRILIRKE